MAKDNLLGDQSSYYKEKSLHTMVLLALTMLGNVAQHNACCPGITTAKMWLATALNASPTKTGKVYAPEVGSSIKTMEGSATSSTAVAERGNMHLI